MNQEKDRTKEIVAVVIAMAALVAAMVWLPGTAADRLKLATGFALLAIVFGIGAVLVINIATGAIDLGELLEELDGGASMSRFQMLVFTFVVALAFFHVTMQTDRLPELSTGVLTLLGISASTYGVSKGIQVNAGLVAEPKPKPATEDERAPGVAPAPR